MNLTAQPIHQKPEKIGPEPAYLAKVRQLPCCICEAFGMIQNSPTAAHHCIMGRHGTRRSPDRMAIPLCEGCHQGMLDTSKIALHRSPKAWREAYGADTDYIAATQDKVECIGGWQSIGDISRNLVEKMGGDT